MTVGVTRDAATGAPRVAAVIPAYRQPGLLGEAILSVLRQDSAARAVAVVVNDGCPFPETLQTALSFSRAYPGLVYVLSRRNGGLSAARNAGIAFALQAWPDLEAVMFLDADNRIRPPFLSRALAALSAAPAEVGWVYPDIDMIGLPESWSMRGEFSHLVLLATNYCDAGSVVRGALLRDGLRFDETMRDGFEDWDFWLRAAETGHRGQHLPMAGFQYRRRGESMVSQAGRKRSAIIHAMNQKRKAFLLPRNLQSLEAREAPRFAILHPGDTSVRFTPDPAIEGATTPLAKAAARLQAFLAAPGSLHFPAVLCSLSRPTMAVLAEALVLPSVFWLIQVLLRDSSIVSVFLKPSPGPTVRVNMRASDAISPPAEAAAVLAVRTIDLKRPLAPPHESWPVQIHTDSNAHARVDIAVPEDLLNSGDTLAHGVQAALADLIAALSATRPASEREWRRDNRPPRNDLLALYEQICGVGALLPTQRPTDSRGEIGFLIPIHAFGGVEKVVTNQARVLRACGYRPHLFLSSTSSFLLTAETRAAFVSVNPLQCPGFDGDMKGYDYFGAPMSGFERTGGGGAAPDVLGLLCGMNVIINTHSLGGHGIAARLRDLGVRMMVGLHLVERDQLGAPIGNPHMALSYEHAYERFLVISHQMWAWCIAHGVPEAKLLLIPNAPSYAPRDDRETVQALRGARREGPLRVLFLGRLDVQKGIDRLAALIRATTGPTFEWRVIGAKVLRDEDGAAPNLGLAVEPPLHDPAALDAAFDWADVLILPSRFEGVPLTALEARRRGVVVVATRVGAVAEAVTAGGFLVDPSASEAAIHAAFLDILTRLATETDFLRTQAQLAAQAETISWEQSMAPLLRVLAQQ